MKYFIVIITTIFLFAGVGAIAQIADEPPESKGKNQAPETSTETTSVYPIAPGVWYPGDGELPEKPVRYYRVRCWPGCHRGSSFGKYPDIPLGMEPIFPTSTMDLTPETTKEKK